MKTKRFFVLLAVSLVLLVYSCAGEPETGGAEVPGGGGEDSETAPREEAAAELSPNLPDDADFGGTDFRLLLSGWSGVDFEVEELTGDRLDDAIFLRNRRIEEQFNINITTTNLDPFDSFGPSNDFFRRSVRAGVDDFDVFFGIQQWSFVDSMEGLNVEFTEYLPWVNFDKPWWDSGILDVGFGDRIFFAAGDITHSTLGYTTLLLFNKDLFDDLGLTHPYQYVRDGTWTWDRFTGMIRGMERDLNGDGVMTPGEDLFTISGWQFELPYNFHTVLGGNEVIKNAQGFPEINIFAEQSLRAVNMVLDLFSEYGGFFNNRAYGFCREKFMNRQLLFLDVRMFEIVRYGFRYMEDDFGMIPHPKLNESVPHHTQLVNNNVVTVTAVPATNDRRDMTAILLEALAYEGWRHITPEYKEVLLQTKMVRDEDSAEMFYYIWGHRTYRFGLQAFDNVLNARVVGRGERAFVSVYEALADRAEAEIEQIIEVFFR